MPPTEGQNAKKVNMPLAWKDRYAREHGEVVRLLPKYNS